jgi:formylglycine-generating enzyme required for sulfatase activity
MVEINDGLHFCIDSTEVTEAQYEAFAASLTTPLKTEIAAHLGPFCSNQIMNAVVFPHADPTSALPMRNIGWCQAQAFCDWAGKRLCGGPDGGIAPGVDPDDKAFGMHEWIYACTRAGTKFFSYGSAADAGTCNTQQLDGGPSPVEPVGSRAACQGGYPGIYDMLGNAAEWENSYAELDDAGRPNYTHFRGSNYEFSPYSNDCAHSGNATGIPGELDNGIPYVGVRCCASTR